MHRVFSALILLASCAPAQQLVYSTYLKQSFWPASIASDPAGNLYVAGNVGLNPPHGSATDGFVAKLVPDGKSYLYTRDLGASTSVSAVTSDAAGNAYLVGNADPASFAPTQSGPQLGSGAFAFLAKLDDEGNIVFIEFIAGAISAQAVAVTPSGDILVSGISGPGLQASAGAYHVPVTEGRPYLLRLDATGSKVIFCATGIGGSSIALDSAGNIYVAGSTSVLDYPTTPGAYQTTFTQTYVNTSLTGQIGMGGTNQYLTKVDPAGATLLYSTAVAAQFSSTNTGLAVDETGAAYVTAELFHVGGNPSGGILTKLDPSGASALFNVPIGSAGLGLVGGAGVAVDSSGHVYVAGWGSSVIYGGPAANYPVLPGPAPSGFENVPTPCRPNNFTGLNSATVTMLNGSDGSLQGTQWIDGSGVSIASMALVNGKVWLAGISSNFDVPVSPGALSPTAPLAPYFGGRFGGAALYDGAYLGAVDFTAPGPQLACVLDAASMYHAGTVAPNQILSFFGSNLSSETPVAVTFDGVPAQVLYASSSQINVVVPPDVQGITVAQLSVDGVGPVQRQFSVTATNPSLYSQFSAGLFPSSSSYGPVAVARNQDRSFNSSDQPAKAGSTISLYLNGTGLEGPISLTAQVAGINAPVVASMPDSDSVWRVDIRLPDTIPTYAVGRPYTVDVRLTSNGTAVRPVSSNFSYYVLGGPANLWVSQ